MKEFLLKNEPKGQDALSTVSDARPVGPCVHLSLGRFLDRLRKLMNNSSMESTSVGHIYSRDLAVYSWRRSLQSGELLTLGCNKCLFSLNNYG